MKTLLIASLLFSVLLGFSGVAAAASYTLTVKTDSTVYVGTASILISGQVSPPPGPSTAVTLRVFNPNGTLFAAENAPVNGTTGLYRYALVAGGSPSWVTGKFVINATWGAFGPVKSASTTFVWSNTTIITTTTSTTTSTSTVSSTSSSTSSTSTSTTSSTSSSTTSSTTSSTPSTTSSTSSTTSSGGGGIPEFPFSALALVGLTVVIAGAYLFMRSRSRSEFRKPNLRRVI